MYISWIDILQYCCHSHLSFELTPGLNGIIGPNGSGKSAILDAIRMLCTGESDNFGSKTDNITWGESFATVSGGIVHDGVECKVSRGLGTKAHHRLTTPDYEYVKQADVAECIYKMTGASVDTLLNHVFIPQGKIDKILFSTHTERLREFQQTFGLQRAAEAEKALGKEVKRYSLTPGLDKQLEATEDTLKEAQQFYKELQERITELAEEMTELDKYQELLIRYEGATTQRSSIKQAEDRIRTVADRLKKALKSLEEKERAHATLNEAHTALRPLAEEAQEQLADIRAASKAQETRDTLVEALRNIDCELRAFVDVGVEVFPARISDLRAELSKLDVSIRLREGQLNGRVPTPELPAEAELKKRLEETRQQILEEDVPSERESKLLTRIKLKESAFGADACEICHSSVLNKEAIREDLRTDNETLAVWQKGSTAEWKARQLALEGEREAVEQRLFKMRESCTVALKNSLKKLETERNGTETARTDLDGKLTAYREVKQDKEVKYAQLVSLPEVDVSPREATELQLTTDKFDRVNAQFTTLKTELKSKQEEVDREKEDAIWAREARKELGDVVDLPTDKEVAEARDKVEVLAQCNMQKRELLDDGAVLEVKIEQYQEAVGRLKAQLEAEASEARWVGICKRTRELLHVSGLPALMMREYGTHLNRRMRYYLDVWEAPFSIQLDEDLAFTAEYTDGRTHAAARLSGGQRVVASTSFRLSMVDTFAKNVGILALDEPSASLDEDNKQHLQQLLLKLRDLAGSTGKQIILVTHEECYKGFFDNVIDLTTGI